jgi:hypothetical protein
MSTVFDDAFPESARQEYYSQKQMDGDFDFGAFQSTKTMTTSASTETTKSNEEEIRKKKEYKKEKKEKKEKKKKEKKEKKVKKEKKEKKEKKKKEAKETKDTNTDDDEKRTRMLRNLKQNARSKVNHNEDMDDSIAAFSKIIRDAYGEEDDFLGDFGGGLDPFASIRLDDNHWFLTQDDDNEDDDNVNMTNRKGQWQDSIGSQFTNTTSSYSSSSLSKGESHRSKHQDRSEKSQNSNSYASSASSSSTSSSFTPIDFKNLDSFPNKTLHPSQSLDIIGKRSSEKSVSVIDYTAPRRIKSCIKPGSIPQPSRKSSLKSIKSIPSRMTIMSSNTTTTSSTSSHVSRKMNLQFSTVSIRMYDRILTENPSTIQGPSIGIGWTYETLPTMEVNTFETQKLRQSVERPQQRRLVLTRDERVQLLLSLGVTDVEIVEGIRNNTKARQQRKQTIQGLSAFKLESIFGSSTAKNTLNPLTKARVF